MISLERSPYEQPTHEQVLLAMVQASGGYLSLTMNHFSESRGKMLVKYEMADPPRFVFAFPDADPPELVPITHLAKPDEPEEIDPYGVVPKYDRHGNGPYSAPKPLPAKREPAWRRYELAIYGFMLGSVFGVMCAGWAIYVMATMAKAPL